MPGRRGRVLRAVLLTLLGVGGVAASGGVAEAAAPVADFAMSANVVQVGTVVRFVDTSRDPDRGRIVRWEWDLNADGKITDPNGSPRVSRAYRQPGRWRIFLRVTDDQGEQGEVTKTLTVVADGVATPAPTPLPAGPPGQPANPQPQTTARAVNRPPQASFAYRPQSPAPGQRVSFVSSSQDTDGFITSQVWDLDNDGAFDDAGGGRAQTAFASPGAHIVTLRVSDDRRASSLAFQTVTVKGAPAGSAPAGPSAKSRRRYLEPFPLVRIRGQVVRSGVRVRILTVTAPSGTTVTVRCRGAGCPRPRAVTRIARRARVVRFRGVERRLRVGAVLEVMVTRPDRIGKYTRFTVRRGAAPARRDLCMRYGAKRPIRCRA